MGVAATARCKNAGMALRPTIATPPCFKKYRRENLMCDSFCSNSNKTSTQHRNLGALTSLKFRSAEDQSGYYSKVNFFYWIIELGLQDLWAVQLLLQRL
jgi:hypothetical protein